MKSVTNNKENQKIHSLEATQFFRIHPELYNETEMDILQDAYNIISKEKNTLNILDVACGTGRLSSFFLSKGCSVTACDLSSDMLNKLKENAGNNPKLTIIQKDLAVYLSECKAQYDAIVIGAFLHHVSNIYELFDQLTPLIKSGGFIFVTHDPALRTKKSVLFRWIMEKSDSVLFQVWLALRYMILLPRSKSYSYADIHTKKGIDDKKLCKYLESKSYSVIKHKRYFIHKTRIITYIDRFLKLLPQFYFVAKKS